MWRTVWLSWNVPTVWWNKNGLYCCRSISCCWKTKRNWACSRWLSLSRLKLLLKTETAVNPLYETLVSIVLLFQSLDRIRTRLATSLELDVYDTEQDNRLISYFCKCCNCKFVITSLFGDVQNAMQLSLKYNKI